MSWLSYTEDEVGAFHPAFEEVAKLALLELGMSSTHKWLHHPSSMGVGVVPDYVLADAATGRWIIVVEIKRRPDAVKSERNQIQAKGYAEANASYFRAGWPRYFCVTNLEVTQGFALRDGLPPRDCQVEGMQFESGFFSSSPKNEHQGKFKEDLKALIVAARDIRDPSFSHVWPRIARDTYHQAEELVFAPAMDGTSGLVPSVVREYFTIDYRLNARRQMLIRCLIAEYLRGLLHRYDHPQKAAVGPLGTTLAGAANSLSRLRTIDFQGVFEDNIASVYLGFEKDTQVQPYVENYLKSLAKEGVSVLASTRPDSFSLPESLVEESGPSAVRDARGKAATDPELAALLIALSITDSSGQILDPGCGEGNLISAAYDWLRANGVSHEQALGQTVGLEADPLAAKIAALRLVLKEPRLASNHAPCRIEVADMFSSKAKIEEADVIVMNPPFKRYEVQDEAPIPAPLREHYQSAIKSLGTDVTSDKGQSNIFALYVEYLINAAKPGTTVGIVLDNRWFHNDATSAIRELLLRECTILGLVTYPHSRFFEDLMIATSMVVVQKQAPSSNHCVSFARVENPAGTAAEEAAAAIRGGKVPHGWTVQRRLQTDLTSGSWKKHFSASLSNEFRQTPLVKLPTLFGRVRRGSLAKEGGGIAVFEFPERTQYGPKRSKKPNGNAFQTLSGAKLSSSENEELRELASKFPDQFRGYAINKADRIGSYELTTSDVCRDWTIETPLQRSQHLAADYFSERRRRWDGQLEQAVQSLRNDAATGLYVDRIAQLVGLDESVLPPQQLWNSLREPFAGELVIPRKQRVGHRVHLNKFAFDPTGRQVRLSSNFLSYGGCLAEDSNIGLNCETSVVLIAAWLMSSFGHLQFETEANNREGARSLEQHHLENVWVLNPRHISPSGRDQIKVAFSALPFPVRTDVRPELQNELVALDRLFAKELVRMKVCSDGDALLLEVWDRLHDLHEERNH